MSAADHLNSDAVIADLRHRLAEAEDTLRAIREGEVDALVVQGADAEEVFTIGGDSESYRTFMEAMEPGAAALDAEGRVLYLNSTLRRLLGRSLEDVQGKPFQQVFDADTRGTVEHLLAQPGTASQSGDLRFRRDTGGDLHFSVSATPLKLGTITGHAVTFADVTERVRAEAAEQSERAARAVIASANEAVLVCDRDGVITHANVAAQIVYSGNPVGLRFAEAVPLVFSDASSEMDSEGMVSATLAGRALQGKEALAPNAPMVKDYLISAAPLQVAGDQISGCVITMVDLSQRKAAEKQQLLLMMELDHRVKNTLALVLSISTRTLSHEDTLEGFQKAFTGRIQALAATHTMLADKSWTDLSIENVVRSEVAPYLGGSVERVTTSGLDVAVTPRAAIALGLIIHELTTNAVKYGSLSSEEGTIHVSGAARAGEGPAPLTIEWRETGGPEVVVPTRRGFGRTVIARSLQYSPEGGAEVEFDPAGLVCRIAVPSEDLR